MESVVIKGCLYNVENTKDTCVNKNVVLIESSQRLLPVYKYVNLTLLSASMANENNDLAGNVNQLKTLVRDHWRLYN